MPNRQLDPNRLSPASAMQLMNDERKRKNIRLAWILAVFALFIMLTSVPFWTGLVKLGTSGQ